MGKIDMRIERKKNILTRTTAILKSILYDRVNFIHSDSFASVIGKHGE
jgi:hypothetical protein